MASKSVQQPDVGRVAGIRAIAVAGDETSQPVDPRLLGLRRKPDRSFALDRIEVGDVQLFEIVTDAHADAAGEEVLNVRVDAMPRVVNVWQRNELPATTSIGEALGRIRGMDVPGAAPTSDVHGNIKVLPCLPSQ